MPSVSRYASSLFMAAASRKAAPRERRLAGLSKYGIPYLDEPELPGSGALCPCKLTTSAFTAFMRVVRGPEAARPWQFDKLKVSQPAHAKLVPHQSGTRSH